MKHFLRGARHNRQIYAFALLGIVLIIFPKQITNYASELIGGLMCLYGAFDLFMHHFYKTHHIHTGTSLLYLILGAVILFQTEQALVTIGITWGIISLREGAYEVDEIMHGRELTVPQALMLLLSFVFAVMLLFDPFHHFEFHVRLVGFEMIFDTLDFMRAERSRDKKSMSLSEEKDSGKEEVQKREEEPIH